jgi:hypothetical protein
MHAPEMKRLALELYAQDVPLQEIAARTGINAPSIAVFASRGGVKRTERACRSYTDEQLHIAGRMYAAGRDAYDIEAATTVRVRSMVNRLRQLGYLRPRRSRRRAEAWVYRKYDMNKRPRGDAVSSPALNPNYKEILRLHDMGLGPVAIGAFTRTPYRLIMEAVQNRVKSSLEVGADQ